MKPQTLSDIRAHARLEYPNEACGLIVLTKDGDEYFPCRNQAVTAQEHFQMAPEDFANAEDHGKVLALIHSHPDMPPTPSEGDRVACEASGLRWLIIEVRTGEDGMPVTGEVAQLDPSGYEAPYLDRPFVHGVLDCWTLVRDWFARENGATLPNPYRADDWWSDGKGTDMYNDAALVAAGFTRINLNEVQRGDLLLMQVRSKNLVPNHAGIYLDEGLQLFMHHLHGRLSRREVFGGYWLECLRAVYRYTGVPT